ncbi:high nitrogen upregulated cytochrome P450 monooxygenase 2 [Lentinus brumalis]|uniref:High nitrogen upregulated cytochrome P450 monooxygenase 2 n=1 Tax=Lentinus brumalis TaxID=2498619 RepID=A0A371DII3_9APHY|nr:high nitrogen upregulated cytochrome P450 monooxygenase 2 [Polyporus brumalis]
MAVGQSAVLTVILALIAHQIFRRHETYYISVHASLLFGVPAGVVLALCWGSHPANALHIGLEVFKTYLITLGISVAVYRVSPWHPLARFPGPYLRRISHFVSACIYIPGNRSRHFAALHRQYGDVVRTGPNELCIVDPSMIPHILGVPGVPKGPIWVGGSLSYKTLPLVGIADTEEHMRRRRAWNRGLAPSALREYEVVTASRAKQLVQRLQEQVGEINLGDWMNRFTYDFMSDMAFGGGSELLNDGDRDNMWTTISDAMKIAMFLGHVPWLGVYLGYIPPAVSQLKRLLSRGEELAAQRLAQGSTTRDLFHYLNNEDLPDKEPAPRHQLIDDGVLAVVAGSDTTSIVLTSTFYCVLTNPDAYEELQAEIDKHFPPGDDPYITQHHRNMPYLQAVINEALRLFPPVPGGTERRVPQHGEPVISGSLRIPPGTSIFMPPWVLHRDARNFTFPTSFWPERWLIASGQLSLEKARLPSSIRSPWAHAGDQGAIRPVDFVHNESAYIPFSYGPMNCPGKGLALMELRMVVTAVFQHFKIRLREGWDPREYDRGFKDYFNATRPEFPVTLERRW